MTTGRVEARLAELRAEWEKGERRMAELQAQADALRQALLRISGAVQVLEETLSAPAEADPVPAAG